MGSKELAITGRNRTRLTYLSQKVTPFLQSGAIAVVDYLSIEQALMTLWDDVDTNAEFYVQRPHLAHYTSITTAESIFKHKQLWFSNPLFMNDHQEMMWGIEHSIRLLPQNDALRRAFDSESQWESFIVKYLQRRDFFHNAEAVDVYVACFSEIADEDTNGLLSMWRAYASNGRGAAIVIDAGKLKHIPTSPIKLVKVQYLSDQDRLAWLEKLINKFSSIVPLFKDAEDQVYRNAADALFLRILMASICSKHLGFKEEAEWRAIYLKPLDPSSLLGKHYSYSSGERGCEPKLKLPIDPLDNLGQGGIPLTDVIKRVILGPSSGNRINREAFQRMLRTIGYGELANRVVSSSTPFRPPSS